MPGFSRTTFAELTDELRPVIVRDETAQLPEAALQRLLSFRYKERFHLSEVQLMDEPYEALQVASLIWALDSERDNLEKERQKRNV